MPSKASARNSASTPLPRRLRPRPRPFEAAAFVTEQRNPGNEKKVSIVEVSLSSLAEFPGVRFVDTPGLGSIFAHNTLTSLECLPRVGGALLAVSVNHPFSGQDRKLLEEVSQHPPAAAILLTKGDLG